LPISPLDSIISTVLLIIAATSAGTLDVPKMLDSGTHAFIVASPWSSKYPSCS
jgi:hypothetical protein